MQHTPYVLLTSPIFHRKGETFVISKNTDKDRIISYSFNFVLDFKGCFKKMLFNWCWLILIMPAKFVLLHSAKTKLFWKKVCDVIIFTYDPSNKIIILVSNNIVEVVILPKFSNPFTRTVIIRYILKEFD